MPFAFAQAATDRRSKWLGWWDRDRVQPLLTDLCSGCAEADLPAALGGLLAAGAHVRAAALAALLSVPVLESGACPDDPRMSTTLWLAKFDASPGEHPSERALAVNRDCTLLFQPGLPLAPYLVLSRLA